MTTWLITGASSGLGRANPLRTGRDRHRTLNSGGNVNDLVRHGRIGGTPTAGPIRCVTAAAHQRSNANCQYTDSQLLP